MIIFLYGPDEYRRKEKVSFYEAEFAKKHASGGIGRFDGLEEEAFGKIRDFLINQSMFESVKMAVIRDGFSLPDKAFADMLRPYLEAKRVHVLLSESKKPVKVLSFLAKKPVTVREFGILKGAQWKAFIDEEAKIRGVKLAPSARDFLAEAYGGDSWRLATELEKISSMGTKEVVKDDLAHLGIELAPDFWGLMGGLRGRNMGQRLTALETSFARNEPAAKTFNILSALWADKKTAFAEADIAIKSGKMDYEEALVDLAVS